MNSADSEAKEKRGPRTQRRYLPDIVALEIHRVSVRPPKYRFVDSVYADVTEALAFEVEIDGELRLDQAVTPVLYVGDIGLSELERVEGNRYRFLAFPEQERQLKEGAPIRIGWPGQAPESRETKFRFKAPGR